MYITMLDVDFVSIFAPYLYSRLFLMHLQSF